METGPENYFRARMPVVPEGLSPDGRVEASVLATLAYFGALKRLPASRVAAWGFAAPVVAVLVEIGRGDVPQTIVLAGMILAIAGLGITNAAPVRQADPAIKPLRVTRVK